MNKPKIHLDNWIDAQQIAKSNPNCFQVPSEYDLNNIKSSDTVKICNGKERFYVLVKKVYKNGNIVGFVNNMLYYNSAYNYNDLVIFHKKNIYNIHTLEDRNEITKILKDLNIKEDIVVFTEQNKNTIDK
jgi:hypothetical protein